MAQVVVDAHAIGRGEIRQKVFAELHIDIAALGNLDGVLQCLGQVGEQLPHFLGAFQVLLIGVMPRPARVVQGTTFTDADAGFVRLEITLFDEAHVVGRHQRRLDAIGQGHGGVQVFLITDAAGALHFQVEAIRKHCHPFTQAHFGQRFVTGQQRLADFAFTRAG